MDVLAGTLVASAVLLAFWPGIQARLWSSTWAQVRWQPSRPGSSVAGLFSFQSVAELDRLCRQAGRPFNLTGQGFFVAQWVFAGASGVLLAAAGGTALGILAAGMGWYVARVWLKAAAESRQRQIELELPTFLDLWGLLVASGESIEGALVEIVRHHPDWLLSAEMRLVLDRVAASGLLGESLVAGARETGSAELIAVAEQVRQLLDGGGAPSRELARIARRLREERLTALVQAAGTAAVVGIFPKLFGVFLSLLPVIASILITVMEQI